MYVQWHGLIQRAIAEQHSIDDKWVYTLIVLYCMQQETNNIIDTRLLSIRLYESQRVTQMRLEQLRNKGYTENARPGWNITEQGEYLVRSYQIEISRILNNTPLSSYPFFYSYLSLWGFWAFGLPGDRGSLPIGQ
jgi:hypothetical protein